MNRKIATVIVLSLCIVIGLAVFFSMGALGAETKSDSGIFPQIIGISIVILSVISIIQSLRKENITIPMTNFMTVIWTVIITIAYMIIWTQFEFFYLSTFLYVMVLFWLYSKNKKDWKRLVRIGLPVTIATIVFVYLLFEKAMSVRF